MRQNLLTQEKFNIKEREREREKKKKKKKKKKEDIKKD